MDVLSFTSFCAARDSAESPQLLKDYLKSLATKPIIFTIDTAKDPRAMVREFKILATDPPSELGVRPDYVVTAPVEIKYKTDGDRWVLYFIYKTKEVIMHDVIRDEIISGRDIRNIPF